MTSFYKNDKDIIFKAIPLREVGILGLLLVLIIYLIMEWIIAPSSHGNVQIQTKMIIFICGMLGAAYIMVQHKRSRYLAFDLNAASASYSFGQKQHPITSLKIHMFVFSRLPGKIFRINKQLFLAIPRYDNPLAKISDKQKEKFKQELNLIGESCKQNNWEKRTYLDSIALSVNIFFWLLFTVPFILFTTLIIML